MLHYKNYRNDPELWAKRLGISAEAVHIYLDSEVIDLHTCSFIWTRLFGYRLDQPHTSHIPGSPLLNQVDFPRTREAQMGGVVWDITTNPLRFPWSRPRIAFSNIRRLAAEIRKHPEELALVRTESEYRTARKMGLTGCWISIQGGQALDWNVSDLDRIPEDLLHRITLVHFTQSRIGASNATGHPGKHLTAFGKDFVHKMNERRILVDLSHISYRGFFDAVKTHDRSLPFIVSHAGVRSVRDIWRNIDDVQIKAVAAHGGTIGVIYQPAFLDSRWSDCPLSRVVDHMEHIIRIAGDDHVSLGSDFDGFILIPRELHDIGGLPKLVQIMLDRKWDISRIQKVLGENYLRVVKTIRP